jgi:hypothetical protein
MRNDQRCKAASCGSILCTSANPTADRKAAMGRRAGVALGAHARIAKWRPPNASRNVSKVRAVSASSQRPLAKPDMATPMAASTEAATTSTASAFRLIV